MTSEENLVKCLIEAADEIEGCGGGNEAAIMREAAHHIMMQNEVIRKIAELIHCKKKKQ